MLYTRRQRRTVQALVRCADWSQKTDDRDSRRRRSVEVRWLSVLKPLLQPAWREETQYKYVGARAAPGTGAAAAFVWKQRGSPFRHPPARAPQPQAYQHPSHRGACKQPERCFWCGDPHSSLARHGLNAQTPRAAAACSICAQSCIVFLVSTCPAVQPSDTRGMSPRSERLGATDWGRGITAQ